MLTSTKDISNEIEMMDSNEESDKGFHGFAGRSTSDITSMNLYTVLNNESEACNSDKNGE